MADDLKRSYQVSVRLNKPEEQQLEGLIGYRGLWELSDLIRAGIQLLVQQERADHAATGETGALMRRPPRAKGTKS